MSVLFSSSWYRVAKLRPRLRSHARIHRHVYRNRPWYVLEDVVNQRVHRFTPATHAVIGLMDGERSVQDLWEITAENLGDDAPTQDEMIRLLAQLHGADVLQCDVPPDTAELLQRYEKRESMELRSRLLSPLALKLPLFDPDRFLKRFAPLLRPLMTRFGAALWLAVVLPALFLAGVHWSELTEGILDRVLGLQSLAMIWLIFPVIKALHELGHGFIARYYGAEVHEMGVMFLVFTPIPYVDASSASAFPEKRERALVASGGMIVEILLAALAFYVWLSVEPGVVRSLAYNTMLIAGVTTLTFNANPLLRFDGYYILADLIEIPNLRQRSTKYLGYLAERWGAGRPDTQPPDTSGIEPFWLTTYAIASFCYRVLVIGLILLFVFELSILLGIVMAAVSAVGWVLMPLGRGLKFLFTSPRLHRRRARAVGLVAALVGGLLALVLAMPLPYRTLAEGVIWVPDEALVRAGARGFVSELLVTSGTAVRRGDALIRSKDPDLVATLAVNQARLNGLRVRHQQARVEDHARARMLTEEIRHLERRVRRAQERLDALTIHAARDGIFVVPRANDLSGRYVDQGELLAYVLEFDRLRVRAVVSQEDIALVRERTDRIAVRRAERMSEVLPATLERVVPSATAELPSIALGSQGGGTVAVDPRDQRGTSAAQSLFQVELALPTTSREISVGGRVHVRFDHGVEPLASRWYRTLRQLFLSRLDV